MHTLLRRALVCLMALLVLSCGGGGGGGGGDGFSIRFSHQPLTFNYVEGTSPPAVRVTGTARGNHDGSLYIFVTITGTGIDQPDLYIDGSTNSAFADIEPASALAPGSYDGQVTIHICKDFGCDEYVSGTPYTIPYQVTVREALRVSPETVTLVVPERLSGESQDVAIDLPAGYSSVVTTTAYTGTPGWLQVTNGGNHLTLVPDASALTVGEYLATVHVQLPDRSQTVAIPVALTVRSGLQLPAAERLELTLDTPEADTRWNRPVTSGVAVPVGTTWQATSSADWLVLDSDAGLLGDALAWHIDPAAFGALANHATHTATIEVVASAVLSPATIDVSVTKAFVEVEHIDALALLSGQGGDLLVYGEGFDALSDPAASLRINGSVAPVSVVRLSDRLLRATLDPLDAGAYEVTLRAVSGIDTSSRTLHVQAPQAWQYAVLGGYQVSGDKSAPLWDGVRGAVVFANLTEGKIQRLVPSGGTFLETSVALPGIRAVGMSSDRDRLLASGGTQLFHELDPVTLATIRQTEIFPARTTMGGWFDRFVLAVGGDNRVWLPVLFSITEFDIDTGSQVPADYDAFDFYDSSWGATSGDGRRTVLVQTGEGGRLVYRDARDGVLAAYESGPGRFLQIASDHQGNRWLVKSMFDGDVPLYDAAMQLAGKIAPISGWSLGGWRLSRDGTRAYVYGRATGAKPRLYAFDTSDPVPADGYFPLLGHAEFDDPPDCATIASTSCGSVFTALTHDDGAMVAVGGSRVVLIPIPAELQPAHRAARTRDRVHVEPVIWRFGAGRR